MDEFRNKGVSSVVPDPMSINAEPAMQTVIDDESCKKWTIALNKYRAGKKRLEVRVKSSESWWQLRNEFVEGTEFTTITAGDHPSARHKSGSAWLHNAVVSKHADAVEAYPQPNILPREAADKLEAWALTKIIPVILQYNKFEKTYDRVQWQKKKTGTGIYKVVWDKRKLHGMGDITISRVNILNIFWQPGVEDIQDSKYFFQVEYVDKEDLMDEYPELDERALQSVFIPTKEQTEDAIPHDDEVIVIDVYYKRHGKLHYAKYVGETVLYASENDPEYAERGFYDHGLYPYVFDVMYPIGDGSPAGYGLVDVGANSQTRIDILNAAITRNTVVSETPRYFIRGDGQVNEKEFLDLNNALVHVNGTLSTDSLMPINPPTISGAALNYLNTSIVELRETTGNTEVSTGSTTAGVTSASGIAAQQEASGKGSRADNLEAYRAYGEVINLVIELIRQFYTMPRQFRITGQMGIERFIEYQNSGMQPQQQMIDGIDMGYRLPVFDIEVQPQKKARHQQATQNDLTLQMFGAGFFNPQNVDQALIALDMMEFDTKDELMQKLAQQGTMYKTMISWQMLGMTLAAQFRPDIVPQLSQQIQQQAQPGRPVGQAPVGKAAGNEAQSPSGSKEHPFVEKARAQAAGATSPEGSKVM